MKTISLLLASILTSICFAEPTTTLLPIADTYVRDGTYANTNYGESPMLNVKTNSASGFNRITFFKFDISSASPLTSAVLKVYANLSIPGSVSVYSYQVPDVSWGETTMTWNNQPSLGNALSSATVVSQTGTWIVFDVSSYLRAQQQGGNSIISIALVDSAPSNPLIDINSREAATDQPELVLTQAFVQTPIADAYVRDGSYANTNFGSAPTLYVKSDTVGFDRHSFVKFQVPTNSEPFRNMRLQLFGQNTGNGYTTTDAAYFVPDNSWGESSITWNNQPALGSYVETTISDLKQYYAWDVSEFLPSSSQISFGIVMDNTHPDPDVFNSREAGSNPPQLILSTSADGSEPASAPILANDGNYYGTTYYGGTNNLGTIYRLSPQGALNILHSFAFTEGGNPYAKLTQGPDGLLYGTTQQYGANHDGSIFRIATDGSAFSAVYAFTNATGEQTNDSLAVGSDGNLYGTSNRGGANGLGTIYRLTPNGAFTLLHSFASNEGIEPNSLICGSDGFLYGTTFEGGSGGYGTIFRISTTGTFTLEYSFGSGLLNPQFALVQLGASFYGSTENGAYFRWAPGGAAQAIFTGPSTLGHASTELVAGTDGNLYGTDADGSTFGELFKLTPAGQYSTLLTFDGTDGSFPRGIARASDGTLYGVTINGGLDYSLSEMGYGLVYKFSAGSENILHYFY